MIHFKYRQMIFPHIIEYSSNKAIPAPLLFISNRSPFCCCILRLQIPSLDFFISVSFSQYTMIQLILILLPFQHRIYIFNFIHGFRTAHAISSTVFSNHHISHKIKISIIHQCAVPPNTCPNQLKLILVITAVYIHHVMHHDNNDRIFSQICYCTPI